MVTVFNRKELMMTFDLNEQVRIRNLLADHGIDYYIKTINRTSPSPLSVGSRGRTGTFGLNQNNVYEYKIYVKKEDYDKAIFFIRR